MSPRQLLPGLTNPLERVAGSEATVFRAAATADPLDGRTLASMQVEGTSCAATPLCLGRRIWVDSAAARAPEQATNAGHGRWLARERNGEELAEAVRFELTEELPLRQFSRLQP